MLNNVNGDVYFQNEKCFEEVYFISMKIIFYSMNNHFCTIIKNIPVYNPMKNYFFFVHNENILYKKIIYILVY